MHPFDRLLYRFRCGQFEQDVNAFDDEGSALVFDFRPGMGLDFSAVDIYLTRCQRAGKCAEQSTGGGRHNVIERGGV